MMLSLDTAYRSFGGEVEASSTPTICRLPDSHRHQLSAIARQTVAIEYGWAQGMSERFAEMAGRFVQLKVDVIVTSGTASVVAAKQATTVIPVVFAVAGDPIARNLVTTCPRPAG